MPKVKFDISVSLDGYITGPDPSPAQGLGEGGERLHEWLIELSSFHEIHHREGRGETNRDSEILEEAAADLGAAVIGRNMFDHAIEAWGENPPFGGPVYVVTHEKREPLERGGGTTFHFVNDAEGALDQAREAADGKDVAIAGGADVFRQYLALGLVDEFQLHYVPIVLGGGTPLFAPGDQQLEFEQTRVVESPAGVTHVRYSPKK
jgi:dihydrofolate reductase